MTISLLKMTISCQFPLRLPQKITKKPVFFDGFGGLFPVSVQFRLFRQNSAQNDPISEFWEITPRLHTYLRKASFYASSRDIFFRDFGKFPKFAIFRDTPFTHDFSKSVIEALRTENWPFFSGKKEGDEYVGFPAPRSKLHTKGAFWPEKAEKPGFWTFFSVEKLCFTSL